MVLAPADSEAGQTPPLQETQPLTSDAYAIRRTSACLEQAIRNTDETLRLFRERITAKAQQLEDGLKQSPRAAMHWVTPFDDPQAVFTPQYVAFVDGLIGAVASMEHVVRFGPFCSFEADEYHLESGERAKCADQILEWLGNL